jgi:hypothetical protein
MPYHVLKISYFFQKTNHIKKALVFRIRTTLMQAEIKRGLAYRIRGIFHQRPQLQTI